jgi:dCMP deaminase
VNTISKQTKWDRRFIELAQAVASWSKDPSTGVGCILTDSRNRVISLGFNGLPHGIVDDPIRLSDREKKLRLIIHSEENAIMFANQALDGCTAYVWPLPPCPRCAGKLIQVGITRVVSVEPSQDLVERWGLDLALAYDLFREAGVRVDLL